MDREQRIDALRAEENNNYQARKEKDMRTRSQDNTSAFGKLVALATDPVMLLIDHAATIPSIERAMRPQHQLDAGMYGRPLDYIANTASDKVEANFPGMRVVAIGFSGSRQEHFRKSGLSVNSEFLLEGADGRKQIAVAEDHTPKGVPREEAKFVNWLLDEKITMVRQGEQWAWHSAKSVDPRSVVVPHKDIAMGENYEQSAVEQRVIGFAGILFENALEEKEKNRAKIQAKKNAIAAEKAITPEARESRRIAELLPETSLPRAKAFQEGKELESVVKKTTGAAPSTPAKKASRL